MDSVKKKLSTGKIVCIVLIVILIAAAVTGGVIFGVTKSNSKSVGKYFGYVDNEKVQNCWIELQKDNTWLNSEGLTGTYTKKGKTITLSGGGLAESMIGTIDGDKISFSSGSSGVIYGQTTPEGAAETEHNFIITLDAQGGTLGGGTTSVNAIYGVAMPTLVAPTKANYAFVGYFDKATGGVQYYDATMTSKLNWNKLENATLYAQWAEANSAYTVTLNANDGTDGNESVTAIFGQAMPTATAPTRTGYTFAGYFDEVDGGGTQYYNADITSAKDWDKTANTTLYAHWTANTYNVTLKFCDGTPAGTFTVATYGQQMMKVDLRTPSRTGYTFEGYYDGLDDNSKQYYDKTMSSANVWDKAEDTTLYAHWTANTYTVTFNKGEGTGGSASVTAIFGKEMPTSADITAPTLENFLFSGYFTQTTGGTQYYNADMKSTRNWDLDDNTTLYARWEKDTTGDYTFTKNPDEKGYTITNYKGTDTVLIIPAMYKDLPVTEIYGFANNSTITRVTIPDRVTIIRGGLFERCAALTTVIFGAASQLKTIEQYAFRQSGLTSIVIPDGVTTIGNDAFSYGTELQTVTFGKDSQLETIGESAFRSSNLTNIAIPDGVTTIGNAAFSGCEKLTTVNFGTNSKLVTIGVSAFYRIDITSIDIPDSVTAIGNAAFSGCEKLTTFNFGTNSKLVTIGSETFEGCSKLLSVTISKDVTTIGVEAFGDCINLTIYAEAASKPDGWNYAWNSSWNLLRRPAVWGVTLSADKTYVESYTKATIDNPTAMGGITAPYREGYTFGGWSTTEGGTTAKYTAEQLNTATDGEELFAIWKKND